MRVLAGASWSNLQDPFEACQEAATLALHKMGEETADLALVFSSPGYSTPELLEGLRAVVGTTMVLGCTDAGNLTVEGPAHQSVAVMLVRAEGLEIRPGAGDSLSEDPEAAGESMARQALEGRLGNGSGPGKLLLAFAEGARGNLSAMLRGAHSVVGNDFPIVGAAAGDDLRFQETTLYCLSYLLKDAVVGLLLGGSVRFGVGTRHGWVPISRSRVVTEMEGSILRKIDGLPALSLYRDYLGAEADGLCNENLASVSCIYPLGFGVDDEDEAMVRFPLRMTSDGCLELGGEVPVGTSVRLMLGSKQGVIDSARRAARDAVASMGGGSVRAAVVFSSFAREKVLRRDAVLEMRAIRDVVGDGVPMVGFYSYGEMAPFFSAAGNGRSPSRYRNDSVVVLVIGEE